MTIDQIQTSKFRVFLPTPPSISSAPPKNLKIPKIPFDHLKKRTDITTPKILPDVDFRKSKYMTSGSQKSSPEVDFRKSKIITGSRLPEIENHHRKSTSGSQKKLRKSTSVYNVGKSNTSLNAEARFWWYKRSLKAIWKTIWRLLVIMFKAIV